MTHACFFNEPATTEIYTLSLHDALPISSFVVRSDHPSSFLRSSLWTTHVTCWRVVVPTCIIFLDATHELDLSNARAPGAYPEFKVWPNEWRGFLDICRQQVEHGNLRVKRRPRLRDHVDSTDFGKLHNRPEDCCVRFVPVTSRLLLLLLLLLLLIFINIIIVLK